MAELNLYKVDLFAQARVQGRTQTDSYLIAHPENKDWKKESLWTEASLFAKKPEVQQRIAELQAEAHKLHQLTVEKLIHHTYNIAFFDPNQLLDHEGKPRPWSDVPHHISSVMSAKVIPSPDGTGGTVMFEFKNSDKIKAIQMLGASAQYWNTDRRLPASNLFAGQKEALPPGDEVPRHKSVNERDLARTIALMLTAPDYVKDEEEV